MIDFEAINQGFSREAPYYDAEDEKNPVIRWARSLVRKTITGRLPAGSSILEINAGTGVDALWLVEHGYRVHATDIADGMVEAISSKIKDSGRVDRFTVQRLSFTELERVKNAPFDGILSNLGGLNCAPDLSVIVRGLSRVLQPGGWVVLVCMPPVCPWELVQLLRGRWHTAVRRLRRGGVVANVRGAQVMTYYFTPRQIRQALGTDFKIHSVQSFSLFCPPMYMQGFPKRFPRLTKLLMRLDESFGGLPLLRNMGDFFILTARYNPRRT